MGAKSDEVFLFRILETILKNKLLAIPQSSLYLQIMMRKMCLMRRMDGKYQESTTFLLKEKWLPHFLLLRIYSQMKFNAETLRLSKIYIYAFIYKKNSLTILGIHPFLYSKCTNFPLKKWKECLCIAHIVEFNLKIDSSVVYLLFIAMK